MKKRILCFLFALIMVLSVIPVTAIAAEEGVMATEVTAPTVSVDKTWAAIGTTFDVRVTVKDNPGILGATLRLSWDEGLTLVGDKNGTAFEGLTYQKPSRYNAAGTNFVWYGSEVENATDGTVLTLTFSLDDTARADALLAIRLSCEAFDNNGESVAVVTENGQVQVISYIPGDVTNDGNVNVLDLIKLSQYISDGCVTDPEGYNVTVNTAAADVDDNGFLNTLDLILLSRYISDGCVTDPDGYNITLKPSTSKCAHDLTAVEHKEPTCTEDGNCAYWVCASCDKCFADAVGATEITLESTVLAAEGHELVAVIGHEATCTQNGNLSYWTCTVCEKCFSDDLGNTEISIEDTVITADGHALTPVIAKDATCTEAGNIPYWLCTACGKYFSDNAGRNEILLAETVIPATGHQYSDVWSSDGEYHWHGAICGHADETRDKATHTLNAQYICTTCRYNATIKLSTPVISKIEYDKIYWTPVENANYYTVCVNDNYECVLRGTECSLKNVLWNGSPITEYGYISVTVKANGYEQYSDSDFSAVNRTYFYVPETQGDNARMLIDHSIGFGYNLVEDVYFDSNYCSQKSVFNVGKLLTIGNYTARSHSGGTGYSYNYSSIDEFISKTKLSFEYGQNVGCALLGSVKMQINADLGLDYRKYSFNETYIYEYNWTYKDHVITNFSDYNLLAYCLSDDFVKDIKRESWSTQGMSDDQVVQYLFDTYGTHAILGVTTGGTYIAQYVISTNEEDIAASVKIAFDLSTGGGGAIDQIIQKDFNIGIDVSEDLSWKNATTEAHFNTFVYGGSGGGATSAVGVESAIQTWTASLSEDNARSVMFTENGAIALSSLIAFVDNSLAIAFENYISERADATYHELYDQYTKPTSLSMQVETEDGKNVLKIDLSSYQKGGTLSNAQDPNFLEGVLRVYPVMFGKDIHKIVIIGAFDEAESRNLIDKFSISLSSKWNRNVEIEIENLGVAAASPNGLVDTSNIVKNIDIAVRYVGINVIKQASGVCDILASVNDECYSFSLEDPGWDDLDFSATRIDAGEVYLPQAEKDGHTFLGWFDSEGNQVSDALGKANINAVDVTVVPKWKANSVIFDGNGGSVALKTKNFNVGKAYGDLPIPKRAGYIFDGWYLGDTLVTPDTIVLTAENHTLTAKWLPYQRVDGNGNPNVFGDYILFGEYPQSVKADGVIITATTDERGYYLGSDGAYYAKVTATPYKNSYTFSTGESVTSGTVYYFKVEPIRWRILSESGDTALILCDSIIANKRFDDNSNNYANSEIRAWLNDQFYKTAFTELQRELINTVTVNNAASTTGDKSNSNWMSNPYACANTSDKLFLLSYEEVTKSAYGFASSYSTYDTARRMQTSDYARATGACMSTSDSYYGNGFWWLRSPYFSSGLYAREVYSGGNVGHCSDVDGSHGGVVPALQIRLNG